MNYLLSKTIFTIILIFFPAILFAQGKTEVLIDGAKFFHPIVEKWVSEYKKENPDIKIELKTVQNKIASQTDLQIRSGQLSGEADANNKIVYVGRYALIPLANVNNPLLEKAGKGLKKKDITNLLFEKDILAEDYDADEKEKYTATVYSRGDKTPVTAVLAGYFDQSPDRIRGKKIIGDEIYLLNAIQKDETGITFNTLNYAFDLKSRQLKANLSILPLNVKSGQKEVLDSHDIDKLIALLEESKIETIPVENFGLLVPKKYSNNNEILDFLEWVLSDGQKYNREYGFLSLDDNVRAQSKKQLALNSYKPE
ncbi:MAG: extracellular solute-binding protein [Dysgonamonadaceae bacterium]|jgi:ABC-type phosphate transport system substrate-binding protein|nr:extracellular solute-binding protein [Dysgonamonadaceae bacterium]